MKTYALVRVVAAACGLSVLISGLVTIFGLMYVAGEVSTAIGDFANWLLSNGGAGAGLRRWRLSAADRRRIAAVQH